MKPVLRFALFTLIGLLVMVAAGLIYVKLALPDVGPAPTLAVRTDSAQVAHGAYLANHVAACMDCHSTRDWTRLTAPMLVGTQGKGGEGFLREMGFPGNYYAPNLTPAHLGDWTDGEIYRAITMGVSNDGHALFPVMPYLSYGQMAPADIYDIIAYLRTLKPLSSSVPVSQSDFPMNFIVNTIPVKAVGGVRPTPGDEVAYGRYLISFANCADCHTKLDDKGQQIPELAYAGGNEYALPTGTVRSCNLTPDPRTGIGRWSKAQFIVRFKAYAGGHPQPAVAEGGFNSIMPWTMYAEMTEQDLGAIYTYLRTVKPISHPVKRFTPKPKLVASR